MSKPPIISRRSLLAGFWLAGVSSAWAQVRGGRSGDDQGIGGTGVARIGDDHGIGGTGIVGVIQRFGSIFVNGERIGYAPDVPVRIDGEAASVEGAADRTCRARRGDAPGQWRADHPRHRGRQRSDRTDRMRQGRRDVGAGPEGDMHRARKLAPRHLCCGVRVAPNRRRHRRQPGREAPRQRHARHGIAGARSRRDADRWLASYRCGSGADRSARSRRGPVCARRDAGRARETGRFLRFVRRQPLVDRRLCAAGR